MSRFFVCNVKNGTYHHHHMQAVFFVYSILQQYLIHAKAYNEIAVASQISSIGGCPN